MTRQGRCVLRPDESGRILDRLAGLEQVIKPTVVRQVLSGRVPRVPGTQYLILAFAFSRLREEERSELFSGE